MNKKGFTLLELLVVVLIIGILAAIALPRYRVAVEKSRIAETYVVLNKIKQNIKMGEMSGAFDTSLSDAELAEVIFEDTGLPVVNGGIFSKNFCYVYLWGVVFAAPDCPADDPGDLIEKNYVIGWNPAFAVAPGQEEDITFCGGFTDFGKKVCKSICGSAECDIFRRTPVDLGLS